MNKDKNNMNSQTNKKNGNLQKFVSLHDHQLVRFGINTSLGMVYLLDFLVKACGYEDSIIFLFVKLLLLFAGVVFIGLQISMILSRKVELEDEMATDHMNKARKDISIIVMGVLLSSFIVAFVTDAVLGIHFSLEINETTIYKLSLLLFFVYSALESGLFLWHEGKKYTFDEKL